MINILVITKLGSERHLLIADSLDKLGVKFETIDAIFPNGDYPWSKHYDHIRRENENDRIMSVGEVGCFLSHREAWKAAARSNQPTLILEDDARMSISAASHLECLARAIDKEEKIIMRLHSIRHPSGRIWRSVTDKVFIVRPSSHTSSGAAYMINANSAKALLANSVNFSVAVDDYQDLEYKHKCIVMLVYPEMISTDDSLVSTIGSRTKSGINFFKKIKCEALRFKNKLRLQMNRGITLWRLGIMFRRKIKTGKASSLC